VRQQVDRPAEQPCGGQNDSEARQEIAAELPRLVLRDLLGQQAPQPVRFDIRRMQHHPTS
jgi:hypothetical protein